MVAKAVKVTRKGQITLPVELRREFDINEGDIVYVRKGEHGIEITTPEDFVSRTAGMFKDYVKDGPIEWDRDQIWTDFARERYERLQEYSVEDSDEPTVGPPHDRD